jgi:pseudaminic acid synthase
MRIGSVEIGSGFPCRIVAELSNNHNGDRDRLGRLIDAAKAAGADLVKFQAYTPEELVALRGDGPAPEPWGSQGYTMHSLYEKAQTPLDWFSKIRDHCDRIGMPWFSSVFGSESLAALEAVGCPAYKISHFEYRNDILLKMVRMTHKPMIVSVPVKNEGDMDVYTLPQNIVAVLCPGGYPALVEVMHLRNLFPNGDFIGLSSHCRHPLTGVVATARGAKCLEYHFHMETEPSELESNVSLNEREFAAMVRSVRQAEVLIG